MAEKRKAAGPPAVVVAVLLLPLLARLQVTPEILVVGHLRDLLVGVGVADDVPIEEENSMSQPHNSPEDEKADSDDDSVEEPPKLLRRSIRPKLPNIRLKPSFDNKEHDKSLDGKAPEQGRKFESMRMTLSFSILVRDGRDTLLLL